MNLHINGVSIYPILLITFMTSFLLIYPIKKLAKAINAMDVPNARKVHSKPMPRLGGLAIFGAFLVGYMLYGQVTVQMISILIASIILILMGIFDDICDLRAKIKIIFHIIAATIVVFYGNIYFNEISIIGLNLTFPLIVSQCLSVFFIISLINAINLIDGLDGLSSGISSIYFVTIGIIAYKLNLLNGLDVMLCVIMLGSTLGFLVHNFPPAKIFAGEVGSTFLGFMVAVIALLGFKAATVTTIIIPVIILAIPIFDTLFAIFRRLLKKQNIGVADKEHFHHQLLKLKFSNRASILIIYFINMCFASVSIFFAIGDKETAMTIYMILMILLLFVVLKTDILFEHKKRNNNDKK